MGRFQEATEYRLNSPSAWLNLNGVVTDDNRLLILLSIAYLIVCLANAMVLLLVKFLRRTSEIGIRRALGATGKAIFAQYMIESVLIGFTAALLGLFLSLMGMSAVRSLYSNYLNVANISTITILCTVILGVVASCISGIFPAWHVSRGTPTKYIKALQ